MSCGEISQNKKGKKGKGEVISPNFWSCPQEGEQKRGFRERSSNFSLRSTEIEPLVFIEARGKVSLHDESFAWVLESGFFAKLQKVRVFFYLGYF